MPRLHEEGRKRMRGVLQIVMPVLIAGYERLEKEKRDLQEETEAQFPVLIAGYERLETEMMPRLPSPCPL